jgi:hypothetical protein
MAQAFDEWLRRYVEEPEKFEAEFRTVERFVRQGGADGEETDYGESQAAYLQALMAGEL